jgi:hypothetical protein
MGDYSTFLDQEISAKDKEGLLKFKKSQKDNDLVCGDEINNALITDEGEINFEAWDDNKIESYWYDETMEVLEGIAPYIEGKVEFNFNGEYDFRIIFREGKLFFQRQSNEWLEETPLKKEEW